MRELLLAALLWLQQTPNPATGVISGTLLYSDGTPAATQLLRLVAIPETGQQPRPARAMVTDANGVFSQRVSEGRYVLQTGATNPTYYPGVLSQNSATPIVVAAGSTTSGLNFSLPLSASGVRVQGRVALPQGYPISASGLRITLSRDNAGRALAADGTFEFTYVLPGTYPLSISAPGSEARVLTVSDKDYHGNRGSCSSVDTGTGHSSC